LQAVGPENGLIGGDCEPDPAFVGAECEPKTPLVCEPIAHRLRAVTPNVLARLQVSTADGQRQTCESGCGRHGPGAGWMHGGHGPAGAGNRLKPRRLTSHAVIDPVAKVPREAVPPLGPHAPPWGTPLGLLPPTNRRWRWTSDPAQRHPACLRPPVPLVHAASGAACRMRLSGLCRVRPPSLEPATILKYGVATWGNTAEEAVTHSDEAMHIVLQRSWKITS
jgi:hypothetical protein